MQLRCDPSLCMCVKTSIIKVADDGRRIVTQQWDEKAFLSTSSKTDTIKGKRFCQIKKDCYHTFTSHLPETRKGTLIIQVLRSSSPSLTSEGRGSGSLLLYRNAHSSAHLTLTPGLCNGPSMFGDKLPTFVVQPKGALCLIKHSSGQHKRTVPIPHQHPPTPSKCQLEPRITRR